MPRRRDLPEADPFPLGGSRRGSRGGVPLRSGRPEPRRAVLRQRFAAAHLEGCADRTWTVYRHAPRGRLSRSRRSIAPRADAGRGSALTPSPFLCKRRLGPIQGASEGQSAVRWSALGHSLSDTAGAPRRCPTGNRIGGRGDSTPRLPTEHGPAVLREHGRVSPGAALLDQSADRRGIGKGPCTQADGRHDEVGIGRLRC
jgi:hypothetical protein